MLIACGEILQAFLEGDVEANEALARLPDANRLHPCSSFIALLNMTFWECVHHEDDRDRRELTTVRDMLLRGHLPDTSALQFFKPQPWWALANRRWLRRIPVSSYALLFYCADRPDILGASFDRIARYQRLVVDSEPKAIQVLHDELPEVLVTDTDVSSSIVAALRASETALYQGVLSVWPVGRLDAAADDRIA